MKIFLRQKSTRICWQLRHLHLEPISHIRIFEPANCILSVFPFTIVPSNIALKSEKQFFNAPANELLHMHTV